MGNLEDELEFVGYMEPTSIKLGYAMGLDESGVDIDRITISFTVEEESIGFVIPSNNLRTIILELSDFADHIGQ